MARTSLRQDTQIRNSKVYDDSVAPSEAAYETSPATLLVDLDNIRSQLNNLLTAFAGNWYDDLVVPAALEAGLQRGLNALNDALHLLEKKRFLREAPLLVDVLVGTGENFVVLGAGELPGTLIAAVGAVTTLGTVTAAHGGTFGTHSLAEVAGGLPITPHNLVQIYDGSTRDVLLSGGRQVFGLLQGESGLADGGTITTTTPARVQLSFVRTTATGDDLEAVPFADIQDRTVNYSPRERVRLEDLLEADLLGSSSAPDPVLVDFVVPEPLKPDPTFTYAGGLLTQVDYADGRTKLLTYDGGGVLERVVADRLGGGQVQKDFTYNGDGTLAAVATTLL